MRILFDDELVTWEAWNVPSPGGAGRTGQVVFRCVDHPDRRARVLTLEEPAGRIEGRLQASGEAELRELLSRAEPIR
jgi:hypothetical protein